MANSVMQQGGYQPQAPVHQPMTHQLQHPVQQPQLTVQQKNDGFQNIDWASQIADVMRNRFGLKLKKPTYMYRRPYPEAYDQIAMPHQYRVPNFTKFSAQDNITTVEHISRFLVQCGEAPGSDALKICLFSLSLSGSALAWFSSLPANSIVTWADLEK
jgi:hypothetical protein